jgi:hypothetical protein
MARKRKLGMLPRGLRPRGVGRYRAVLEGGMLGQELNGFRGSLS